MKNILPLIPTSTGLREEITSFVVGAVKPFVDEKGMAVGGIRLYVLCLDKQEEENVQIALKLGKPDWFKKDWLERKFMDQFIALEEN
ncbi:MAG: hypothetical protein H7Y27_03485, partial [Gemmatimonadaceae bacterium]|nr:hypothetical protein [Chitinophagaceae bacterium]